MKKFHLITVLSLAALSATGAFAQTKGGTPGNQKPISWAELKDRCMQPGKYQDVQVAPANIKLQCDESITHFVAAAPGEVPLPGHATIVTSVFSDKFTVSPEQDDLDMPQKAGSCQRFVEVTESFLTERPVSCAEVLSFKGELKDFCEQVVNAGKGSNPKGVQVKPTGRVIDTCGANAVQNAGGGKAGLE